MKSASIISSTKACAGVPTPDATTASKQVDTLELPSLMTECAASSPLRTAKPPSDQFRVHDSFKEQKETSPASTPTPSPPKELETTTSNEAPELDSREISSPHLVADEVPLTRSPETKVDLYDEPSSIEFEKYSDHAIDQGEHSLDRYAANHLHQIDDVPDDSESSPASMDPPIFADRPAFVLASPMIAGCVDDSESEDEDVSPEKRASMSPLKDFGISARDFGTPTLACAEANMSAAQIRRASLRATKRNSIAMTPLAMQLSSWLASSPEKKAGAQAGYKRGVFSPARPIFPTQNQSSPAALTVGSPAKQSFFEDEMAVRDANGLVSDIEEGSTDEPQDIRDDGLLDVEADSETSFDSQASEVYGDENAVPEDQAFGVEQSLQDNTLTCTPAKVFGGNPREIHTVSKVPLRPAADDTPLMVPRKRSKSLTAPLSEICMPDMLSIGRDSILSPILQDTNLSMSLLPGAVTGPDTPETPTTGPTRASCTPGRSIRKAGYSNVLKGAVVHVDVHTTEGAEASGIFVDLLTQMGARCVKQWHWNPQASGASPQPNTSPEVGIVASKVGITHVVYKDGGKRTLEKVREAKGAVLCVGVGWVLEYVLILSGPRKSY